MATKAPKTTTRLKPETEKLLDEIGRVSQEAVRKMREENRRLGIPNFQMQNGQIVAEMPDGRIESAEEGRRVLVRKSIKS